MLYECREITLDLARIVTIERLRDRRGLTSEGKSFHVQVSGIRGGLYFRAPDRTPAAEMAVMTDYEALRANWRKFKNTRPDGSDIVFGFPEIDVNLHAVCAVTQMRSHAIGMGGCQNPPMKVGYMVHVMGVEDPVKRLADYDGSADEPTIQAERNALIRAWAAAHRKVAA